MSVNRDQSKFTWRASKLGAKHHGQIFIKEVSSADNGLGAGTRISMDMSSITDEDMKGELRETFLNHIKSADFFEIEKYPESSLLLKEIGDGELSADLTIKGKTKALLIPFIKEGSVYKGTMQFDRTDFDMKYGSGSFFKNLGDNLIHDDVFVDFELVVEK